MATQDFRSFCRNLPAGDRIEKPRLTQALRAGASHQTQRAAAGPVLWQKSTLRVAFTSDDFTTQTVADKVKEFAPTWSQFCNIKFEFISNPSDDPDVLVNARPWEGAPHTGIYQSSLGKDALDSIRQSQPSMDLIFDVANTPDVEYRRVILHEFGHVLGMIHEHTRNDVDITWTQDAVAVLEAAFDWPEETVRAQIIEPFPKVLARATAFDPKSIMMYPIPRGIAFVDGQPFSADWNLDLSDHDKQFAGELYGSPADDGENGEDGNGDNGGTVVGTVRTRNVTLDASVQDSIDQPGLRFRYFFILPARSMVQIATTDSTQILRGELLGPDSDSTHFRTVGPESDGTNLFQHTSLDKGRWCLEVRCADSSVKATYRLSIRRE